MKKLTKTRILIWSVIVLIIINLSSLGTIWFHNRHMHDSRRFQRHQEGFSQEKRTHSHRSRSAMMKRTLDLTTVQAGTYDSIWNVYSSRIRTVDDQLKKNRQALSMVMSDNNLNTPLADSLIDEQTRLMSDMNHHVLDLNAAMREILTDKQREKYLLFLRGLGRRRGFIPNDSPPPPGF